MAGAIAHDVAEDLREALRSSLRTPDGEAIDLPDQTRAALVKLVDVLEASAEVVVLPVDVLLSTQQVADVLGVSRMTVTRIIDRGELEVSGAGGHRRVAVPDLARYRSLRKRQRRAALHGLAQEIDDDTAPDRVVRTR